MKRLLIGIIALLFLYSCGNKKSKVDPFGSLTSMVDSAINLEDTLIVEESKEPQRIKADESFDDFLYSFASDPTTQKQRIIFPLPFYNNDVKSKIEEKSWKQDPFFVKDDYYTILFENENDMELMKDTSLNSIQFEWIYLRANVLKKFYFERHNGVWMLEAINQRPIQSGNTENFAEFFFKFATDSTFQRERIAVPLLFVTTDPDDDFLILETTLDIEQWFAFMPVLPKDRLSNINYGQENKVDAITKIVALKGIGNGFSNTLYFHRQRDVWQLYKFEDLSN